MTKEDTCLTFEQAQQLRELGINMDNAINEFVKVNDTYELKFYVGTPTKYSTLTNTEMLDMLPEDIDGYALHIVKSAGFWNIYYMEDYCGSLYKIKLNNRILDVESETFLLRDSLYEILRYLILSNNI